MTEYMPYTKKPYCLKCKLVLESSEVVPHQSMAHNVEWYVFGSPRKPAGFVSAPQQGQDSPSEWPDEEGI